MLQDSDDHAGIRVLTAHARRALNIRQSQPVRCPSQCGGSAEEHREIAVFAPGPFRSAGLYSTAIAGRSDVVSPRAPFWGLGQTVTIPGAQKSELAINAYLRNALLNLRGDRIAGTPLAQLLLFWFRLDSKACHPWQWKLQLVLHEAL